jgi:hypothetical protein
VLKNNAPAIDRRDAEICFALFVVGALAGLFQMYFVPTHFDGEMVAIAKNLASHGAFANPFYLLDTGYTAANPPLFPLFLAGLIKVFRNRLLVFGVAVCLNIIVDALVASLLPRVSRLVYGSIVPGVVAALLWLASIRLMPNWDVSYTVAILLIFCIFTASLHRKTSSGVPPSLLAGCIASMLFMLNPSSLFISMPWLGYLALRHRISLRQITILLAVLVFTSLGWMVRNHHRLGAYVLRTNFGFTLYASNNDCAASSWIGNELNGCFDLHHPNQSLAEVQLDRSLGEVQYDKERTADAIVWIRSHPQRFRVLTLERVWQFWFPVIHPKGHPYSACAIWLGTALSIPGLVLMMYRREPATVFVLTVLFIYPLLYYLVISDTRYRYPVLWLSLLPAGYFVWQLMPHGLKMTMGEKAAESVNA